MGMVGGAAFGELERAEVRLSVRTRVFVGTKQVG